MIPGRAVALGFLLVSGTGNAFAEPMFLSKQYTRCSSCHFSPTGGGLLTSYGRSLSKEELSTTGRGRAESREQEFLFGALQTHSGLLSLGITLRPAHLNVSFPGGSFSRNFFMNADISAALRKDHWTAYAEFGRQGRAAGPDYRSFEHWIAYQKEKGLGIRVGRFLPAYGVRFADHTTLTRASLGFDLNDQVYAAEVSHTTKRSLLQLSIGPGRANSLTKDDGRSATTGTGRLQIDLGSAHTLVVSGLVRGRSDIQKGERAMSVAFGIAPLRRLSLWTEANARFVSGVSGAGYNLAHETAFEAYRGVWLKFTPQLRTNPGDSSSGIVRTAFSLDLLPRTHWNVGVLWNHDKDRKSDRVNKTLLAQLHIYL